MIGELATCLDTTEAEVPLMIHCLHLCFVELAMCVCH
jgi:hypothetical protein